MIVYERNKHLAEKSSLGVKRMYKKRQVAKKSLSLLGGRQALKGMWELKERRHQQNWRCRRSESAGWGSWFCILYVPKRA